MSPSLQGEEPPGQLPLWTRLAHLTLQQRLHQVLQSPARVQPLPRLLQESHHSMVYFAWRVWQKKCPFYDFYDGYSITADQKYAKVARGLTANQLKKAEKLLQEIVGQAVDQF